MILHIASYLRAAQSCHSKVAARLVSAITGLPIIIVSVAVLLLAAPAGAATYTVSTASDFQAKLNIVNPGDTIILANGTYIPSNGKFTLSRSGSSSAKIVIKPQNLGGAILKKHSTAGGALVISGSYVQVGDTSTSLRGFIFDNCEVQITGSNNRVTRNTFKNGNRSTLPNDGKDAAVCISGSASNNQIDYNEITNWAAYGIRLTATTTSMTGNWIHHNYIHDSTTVSNAEAIQLGSGSSSFPHNLGTIVEYNLVSNIDTDEEREVISVKSSGNTIRYNTFSNPNQDNIVSQRGGNNNTYKNNTLKGYDLATYGANHYVIGNRLEKNASGQNGRLLIKAGKPDTHSQSVDQKVGGNLIDGAFVVGHQNTSSYTLPAVGTRYSMNTNLSGSAKSPTLALQSDTQAVSPYPGTWPAIGTPVEVTVSQVGPAAGSGGGAPAAPSGLSATTASYNQINLSWSDVSNETGYKVERKKGSGGTYAQIGTTAANVVTYNDATCGAGTTYYYRVRAYNGSGDSAYSNEANATSSEITSGRQGHWKLNESSGTTAADSSGNSNTGTLTGGPAWTTGKIGNGLSFDGIDDIVTCGSGASLDNLAALTLSAWIKPTDMGEGGFGRIIVKTNNGSAGWEFMTAGTNQLTFSVDYATTDLKRRTSPGTIATGAWQHVLLTWTGSATATNIKVYVNNAEVAYDLTTNASGARVDDGSSSLYLGNLANTTRTFKGVLDDVRVYNRVLSAAEILAIYRAGL